MTVTAAPRELRPDQIQDLGRLFYKERRCIHGGEPGTGKTPTICVLQRARWDKHGHRTLWLMPMKLLEKNLDEALLWGEWGEDEVVILDGPVEPRHLAAKVVLMGYTRFELSSEAFSPEQGFYAVDIDEWHKAFGGHESKRTQALYRWCARRGKDLWFVPMTGTSYNGRPSTVYPAIQVIEPRYYGTPEAFDMMHNIVDPWSRKVVGHDNLDRLEAILSKHSIKRLWSEVHGPEELVVEIARCRMNERQRKAYETFRETALLELEQFFVDGTKPGVAFTRARQIMEHPNAFPDLVNPGQWVDICPGETPGKLEEFGDDCEKLTSLARPLLAYAALKPQQRQMLDVARAAGRRAEIINGDTSPKQAGEIDKAFIAGRLDTIIGSPRVADCGFNWQFCGAKEVQDVLFVSMDYQDTAFFQAYKRAMREARRSALRIKISTYVDSIDQHIMRLTKRKSQDAAKVERGRVVMPW
ncbi:MULTISPECIES: SNF2-related protein [Methylobacterium]|jgi:hypothetical protein|uniref:SNF2 N-terminal domain-containing protein n=5 Tax=Pseudomonadota TaxID=1224 RepID=A0ABQ4T289_9HYPH|nr:MULTISPECIES: SNF2-related protein [Methylobacterium]PIU05263.1 MAG: hypothetical protein COT56_15865 [Methylobacterium sp. CG09_land_8_20_14_0_10_71_15]PIU12006.1 MAG: hypothetical protein COT28_17200 [Methylobacterium sp. CG08_land_8_20_14_0_20_71_15]GBU16828.1 hypothetical protein AwMethylo_10430 [Methylobacterium sp.]GJE08373.1 hypothetical protein AOPFMNJM_3710 [Methylobacterium jeotgali]